MNAIDTLVTNRIKFAQLKNHSRFATNSIKIAQLQAEGKRLMSKH